MLLVLPMGIEGIVVERVEVPELELVVVEEEDEGVGSCFSDAVSSIVRIALLLRSSAGLHVGGLQIKHAPQATPFASSTAESSFEMQEDKVHDLCASAFVYYQICI